MKVFFSTYEQLLGSHLINEDAAALSFKGELFLRGLNMAGIKETKELLKFVIEVTEALDRSLEDGEIGFTDLSNLVSAMMASAAAFENVSLIPSEMKDLDKAEAAELYAYVKGELNLKDDKIEAAVEAALEIGLKIYKLINIIRNPVPAPTA
jgi:hypothetical protein